MRKSKKIIATAVMAALLLSGCAQENKGVSEAGSNTQQTPSVSSTTQIADSSADNRRWKLWVDDISRDGSGIWV